MALADSFPPRLLLIEGDEELLLVLAEMLAEEGYLVKAVPTLAEALTAVQTQAFDLLLHTVVGWAAEEPLAAVERLRDQAQPTPVALMTRWNLGKEEASEREFVCLISKPFDLDDLLAQVAACLARPL